MTGNPCALAAAVEADWALRVPGAYEPIQHLRHVVGALRHRTGEDWMLEHDPGPGEAGPRSGSLFGVGARWSSRLGAWCGIWRRGTRLLGCGEER